MSSPAAAGTIVRMTSKRPTRREGADSASLADRLAADFHAQRPITRRAVNALERSLRSKEAKSAAVVQRWRQETPLGVAGMAAADQAALIALQTWYLLVVKLVAAEAVAISTGRPSIAAALHEAQRQGRLRAEIEFLESGALWRNLLPEGAPCGELFAWHVAAWSDKIEQAVGELAAQIGRCPKELFLGASTEGRDVFRRFHQVLFPRKLRHALGEYYTPDWLADHVLDQVGYRAEASGRLLDPSCGSGTFLMAAIRRLRRSRERAEDLDSKGTVPFSSDENWHSPQAKNLADGFSTASLAWI